jgi:hypothetical protein
MNNNINQPQNNGENGLPTPIPLNNLQQPVQPTVPMQPTVPVQPALPPQPYVQQPMTPPVMPMQQPGMPGQPMTAIPMPNLGKKKDNRLILIILLVIVLIGLAVGSYFLFFAKGEEEKPKPTNTNSSSTTDSNTNTNSNERPEWDPSTSKIDEVDDADAVRLECRLTNTEGEMAESTTVTSIFIYDVMQQIIVDDAVEFDADTIKYYDYYAGAANEQLKDIENEYANTTMEVRLKSRSVNLVIAYDLLADKENPENIFTYDTINGAMNYEQTKSALDVAGYRCQ